MKPDLGIGSGLMLIVGEVKEITSARFAYKMIIKHLPDFPVMMNEDMYHRLCNRFSVEIELWSANENGHLMVIEPSGLMNWGLPLLKKSP